MSSPGQTSPQPSSSPSAFGMMRLHSVLPLDRNELRSILNSSQSPIAAQRSRISFMDRHIKSSYSNSAVDLPLVPPLLSQYSQQTSVSRTVRRSFQPFVATANESQSSSDEKPSADTLERGPVSQLFGQLHGATQHINTAKIRHNESLRCAAEPPPDSTDEEKKNYRPRSNSDDVTTLLYGSKTIGRLLEREERFARVVGNEHSWWATRVPDQNLYMKVPLTTSKEDKELAALLAEAHKDDTRCDVMRLKRAVWNAKGHMPMQERAFAWQLMLGCLPSDAKERQMYVSVRQQHYFVRVKEMYEPVKEESDREQKQQIADAKERLVDEEKGMSQLIDGFAFIDGATKYEDDKANKRALEELVVLYRQVYVDVVRTHPGGAHQLFDDDLARLMMTRVLFLWSHIHNNIGYFQGLNEVVTPFFLALVAEQTHSDRPTQKDLRALSQEQKDYIEARLFDGLDVVMSTIEPIVHAAGTHLHSEHMLILFDSILRWVNPRLVQDLERKCLFTIQYAFRWCLCLMLREFPIRDSLILWDYIISDQCGQTFGVFVVYFAAAFMLQLAPIIINLPTEASVMFLNNPPITWDFASIRRLIKAAIDLREKHTAAQRNMGSSLPVFPDVSVPNNLKELSERARKPRPSQRKVVVTNTNFVKEQDDVEKELFPLIDLPPAQESQRPLLNMIMPLAYSSDNSKPVPSQATAVNGQQPNSDA